MPQKCFSEAQEIPAGAEERPAGAQGRSSAPPKLPCEAPKRFSIPRKPSTGAQKRSAIPQEYSAAPHKLLNDAANAQTPVIYRLPFRNARGNNRGMRHCGYDLPKFDCHDTS